MALILDSLYVALKAAGFRKSRLGQRRGMLPDTTTESKRGMALLQWMVGFAIAILLGLFWMQWQSLDRLAALEARVADVETGVAGVDDRLGQLDSRLTGNEDRLTGIEGSFEAPRSDP
jgi:hypothetical protein